MYAYYKKLDYFSTECVYSPMAYRGYARAFIKDLESIRPRSIIDIILSGENFAVKKDAKLPVQGICERCGYISSMNLCKACNLLEGLNRGLPKLGIGKTNRLRKQFNLSPAYSLNSSLNSSNMKLSELSLNSEASNDCSNKDYCSCNNTRKETKSLNINNKLAITEDSDNFTKNQVLDKNISEMF